MIKIAVIINKGFGTDGISSFFLNNYKLRKQIMENVRCEEVMKLQELRHGLFAYIRCSKQMRNENKGKIKYECYRKENYRKFAIIV